MAGVQAALDTAHEADRQPIAQAPQSADDTVREIRDPAFNGGRSQIPPDYEPPDGAQLLRGAPAMKDASGQDRPR